MINFSIHLVRSISFEYILSVFGLVLHKLKVFIVQNKKIGMICTSFISKMKYLVEFVNVIVRNHCINSDIQREVLYFITFMKYK